MIDHVSLAVRDLDRSARFYAAALAPLGAAIGMQNEHVVGIGRPGEPSLWLAPNPAPQPIHLALAARSHDEVRRFHAAALAAGGTDNGPPGPRPQYHANYYAAFIRDLDGHNIEAVCHAPDGAEQT